MAEREECDILLEFETMGRWDAMKYGRILLCCSFAPQYNAIAIVLILWMEKRLHKMYSMKWTLDINIIVQV